METDLDLRSAFAVVIVAALAYAVALLLWPFLNYLLAAALLAFVLWPLHSRVASRTDPRASAGLFVVLVLLAVLGPIGLVIRALIDGQAPSPTDLFEESAIRRTERTVEGVVGVDVPLRSALGGGLNTAWSIVGDQASQLIDTGVHAIIGVLLLLFVLYYLLKDGPAFVAWTKYAMPLPPEVREELYGEADEMTWAVLKGHVFVAVVQGFVSGVGLFATGVPGAALWTVVMMILAIVPIIGVSPVLGGAVVYLFLRGDVVLAGLLVVYGLTVVAIIDDYLRAYLIDRESTMNSAVILVGLFGGTYVIGPMGLFVGPIIIGLFKVTVEVFDEHYGLLEPP